MRGPPYNSGEYDKFLRNWGIKKGLSSAHYPQSNGRAEVAVKSMKRILEENVDPITGDIDTDKATQAIMTHRNTPNQESGVSPAEMLYGYKLRDHLPNRFQKIRREWHAMQRPTKAKIPSARNKGRTLKPLKIGDPVRIQNQYGNRPKKWCNTGKVIEVKPHRQYAVEVDGSKRITLRNRKFLRRSIGENRVHRHHIMQNTVPKKPVQEYPQPSDSTDCPGVHGHPQSPRSMEVVPPTSLRSGFQDSNRVMPLDTQDEPATAALPEVRITPNVHLEQDEAPQQGRVPQSSDAEGTTRIVSDDSELPRRYPTRKRMPTKRLITEM